MMRSWRGDSDLTRLREVPDRVARLLAEYEQQRVRIERQHKLAPGPSDDPAKSDAVPELAGLRQSVQARLDQIRAETRLRARRLDRAVASAIDRPPARGEKASLLREVREQRAWGRLRGILDGLESGTPELLAGIRGLTTELLVAGDDDGLAALRTELPAYLRARGADTQIESALDSLNEAVAAVRPGAAAAWQLKREVDLLLPHLTKQLDAAEEAIRAGVPYSTPSPASVSRAEASPAGVALPPAPEPVRPSPEPDPVVAEPRRPGRRTRLSRPSFGLQLSARRLRPAPYQAALLALAGLGATVWALVLLGSAEARNLPPEAQPVRVAELLLLVGLVGLALGIWILAPDWADLPHVALVQARSFRWTRALALAAAAILGFLAIQFWIGQWQGIYPWLFLLGWGLIAAVFVARDRIAWPPPFRVSRRQSLSLAFIGVVTIAFLWLNLRDVKAWYFSAIGDEYAFLDMARAVLEGTTLPNTQNIFSQRGVFGEQPWLGTVYQAAVMAVFGRDRTGWLISSVLIAAATFLPFFYLVRHLFSRTHAVVATFVLSSSHYVWAISHIGYNNIHALFPTVTALSLSVLALRYGSTALSFAAGSMASLGFYTLYSARATPLIIAAAWLALGGRVGRSRWVAFLTGTIVVLMPIVATDKGLVITGMIARSAAKDSENLGTLLGRFLQNTITSLGAFVFNNHTSHYISGSLMDVVSVVLAVLGIVLSILHFRRFQSRFLLIWFGLALLATGVFSQYDYPAITRLYFMVPVFAVFASLGANDFMEAVFQLVPRLRYRVIVPSVAIVALFAVVLVLNLRRFWYETPSRMQSSPTAVVVRVLTESNPRCNAPGTLVIAPEGHVTLLEKVFRGYGPDLASPKVMSFKDWPNQRVEADAPCAILIPNDSDPIGRALPDQLRGAFGEPNVVSDFRDSARVLVYRRPGAAAS